MEAMQNAAPAAAADFVPGEIFARLNGAMEKKGAAVGVCAMMAASYVAVLYLPAIFLRSPKSIREHMLRRFACAAVASALAPMLCFALLPDHPRWDSDPSIVLEIFGLRTHHLWQAIVLPCLLTGMLYLGPLVLAFLDLIEWCWAASHGGLIRQICSVVVVNGKNMASDVLVWRNCLVAPVSEELVFRACMVPLLLCGGFSTTATVFLCPMFFALAHLHHFGELITRQKQVISTAALIVGMQLGYTTVFGWYATFLYQRTGHLIAPIVAHIVCNIMGLPNVDEALASSHRRVLFVAYVVGLVGFFLVLGPLSDPRFFNEGGDSRGCDCWSGFCKWTAPQKL
ncbi:CAAX protease family protein [Marchantia polymorpha subsp. ruderalis]